MAHDVIEEFRASGRELIDKAREILEEGNVRRMIMKNSNDETLLEIPLTLGVVGVGGAFALAPIISTIAAFAFFVHDARILVERYPDEYTRRSRSHLENELSDENDDDDTTGAAGSSRTGRRARQGRQHGQPGSRKDNQGRDPYEIDADFEVLR